MFLFFVANEVLIEEVLKDSLKSENVFLTLVVQGHVICREAEQTLL